MEISHTVELDLVLKVDDELLEDKVFSNVEEAKKYFMENVTIYLENISIYLDTEDIRLYADIDEEDQDLALDWEYWVDDLLREKHISAHFNGHEMSGPSYDLAGTPNNLIKFMNEYSAYIDKSNPGDALWDEKKELLTWIDSQFPIIKRGFFNK